MSNKNSKIEQEPYFIIESKKLFVKELLEHYRGIVGLYFVCEDENGKYYIVLAVDYDHVFEIKKYIVIKTTVSKLIDLLLQKITMREIILSEKTYWEVLIQGRIEDDICNKKQMKDIDLEQLPDPDSYFHGEPRHIIFRSNLQDLLYEQLSKKKR